MLIAKFKVSVEGKGVYYVVRIYDTHYNMQQAIKKSGCESYACAALCQHYDRIDKNGKYMQEIGTVWFNKENMGVGFVAHEFMHAIHFWAEKAGLLGKYIRKGLIVDMEIEERLCFAHGRMVSDFTKKCYARKLYKNTSK